MQGIHPALHLPLGQRQRGFRARQQYQVQRGRTMLNEERQLTVNPRVLYKVIVVKDKSAELGRILNQRVDQGGNGAFQVLFVRRVQVMVNLIPVRQDGLLKRANHVDPEPSRVIVMLIQREPGNRACLLVTPLVDQGCLTVAGGSGDGRQPLARRGVHSGKQTGPGNGTGSTAGRMNLVASNIFRQSVVPLGTLLALSGLAGGCQPAEL